MTFATCNCKCCQQRFNTNQILFSPAIQIGKSAALEALKTLKTFAPESVLVELEYCRILELIGEKYINQWLKEKREHRKLIKKVLSET